MGGEIGVGVDFRVEHVGIMGKIMGKEFEERKSGVGAAKRHGASKSCEAGFTLQIWIGDLPQTLAEGRQCGNAVAITREVDRFLDGSGGIGKRLAGSLGDGQHWGKNKEDRRSEPLSQDHMIE